MTKGAQCTFNCILVQFIEILFSLGYNCEFFSDENPFQIVHFASIS